MSCSGGGSTYARSPTSRMTLHRVIANGTSAAVLLDLGEAHVGDATGFGLIVECERRARRAGRPMHIVAADDRTRRLLRRARLHSLLSPAPTVVSNKTALAPAAGGRARRANQAPAARRTRPAARHRARPA